jgi:hypothetical protein
MKEIKEEEVGRTERKIRKEGKKQTSEYCDRQKWRWGRFFSENFGFPCQSRFHLFLHNHLHYHPRLAQ